jgi:uncharacterized protein (TIGR00730 family)
MSQEFHLCVFCSASANLDPVYQDAARALGKIAAGHGWHIVYGGGSLGLMGLLADNALAHGGAVTGVIPQMLKDREIAHPRIQNLEVVENMHQRQKRMMDLADGFMILPGGMGTLAEFFEALTWKQLGLHKKPIVIVNINGYWDPLLAQIDQAVRGGFMHGERDQLFIVFDDLNSATEFFIKQQV